MITGGPGTGKTTLINALGKSGFSFLPEVSREVTSAAQISGIDQLFLEDPLQFSNALLEARVEQFRLADQHQGALLFYDRGIPDVMAYLEYLGQPYDAHFVEYSQEHRYDQVLFLPPWADIYTQDKERYESFEQSKKIHEYLVKTYEELGYQSLEIPVGTIEQRIEFVNQRVL